MTAIQFKKFWVRANLRPQNIQLPRVLHVSLIITKSKSLMGCFLSRTIQHFEAVVLCLERDVDAHNDAFEAIYGEYSDEALEKMEDSLNFDEDQPLIDLENNFGFFSLRKHIEDKMEVWLDNTVLNMATNPDDHIILDEETRSLLTPNCEAIIGGQVVDFCDPGIGTVGNGESSISLCSLNNGDCCWWGKDDDKLDYDNDDKFRFFVISCG